MPNSPTARTAALEVAIAAGITAVGLSLGLEPIQAAGTAVTAAAAANPLVDAVTSLGLDWLASLTQRSYESWKQRWLSKHGALNDDMAAAMGDALGKVLALVEESWRRHPHYKQLHRTNPDAARLTLEAVQQFRQDSARLFQASDEHLASLLERRPDVVLQVLDATTGDRAISGALNDYFYGYDAVFQTFIRAQLENLSELWLLQFGAILKDPIRGTPAWRTYQRLLLESMTVSVRELGQLLSVRLSDRASRSSIDEAIHQTITWLKVREEIAERLTAAERDPLGAQTLDRIEEVVGAVERVEKKLDQVDRQVADLLEGLRLPRAFHGLPLDPIRARDLFGAGMRIVDLVSTPPATEEQIKEYYRGAPLTWGHIVANADIRRDQLASMLAYLVTQQAGVFMLCLEGEPGAGKSTLAWRIAAEFSMAQSLPLLQLRNTESNDGWYYLETGGATFGNRIVIVVDDIFRSEDAVTALKNIDSHIAITIVASTRSNELPSNLRLPFPYQFVTCGAPSYREKTSVEQRLRSEGLQINDKALSRLRKANSWLVMMLELTSGKELRKIVADAILRLKRQDSIVHQAYEYLCFVGQYDLLLPETLLDKLDSSGYFYRLLERPSAQGLIFEELNSAGSSLLRPAHSAIAVEALKYYYRDPLAICRTLLAVVSPNDGEQRVLAGRILKHLIVNGKSQIVTALLSEEGSPIPIIVAAAGVAELIKLWSPIYRACGDYRRSRELEVQALTVKRVRPSDWNAWVRLAQRIQTPEQISSTIDDTAAWLAANPLTTDVRTSYLTLVERRGSAEQIAATINNTASWLASNPRDWYSLQHFLGLVERKGSPEQVAAAIDYTAAWLAIYRRNGRARGNYLRLIRRRGSPQQVRAAIDETVALLAAYPQYSEVRLYYLRFIERRGSARQIAAAINDTAAWLAGNPRSWVGLPFYLGLVERKGSSEQVTAVIDNIAAWLAANLQDTEVRRSYLGLVERKGSPGQVTAVIEDTAAWLAANLQDTEVRRSYLGLVERRGSPEQIAALINDTATWLAANPQIIEVRGSYLGLVERKGSPEQIAALIDDAATWLRGNLQESNVRTLCLGLIERKGSSEQVATAIDDTAAWLAANPWDNYARQYYLKLVERKGKPIQVAAAIDVTKNWLAENPTDENVRLTFIQLVSSRAQPNEQQEVAHASLKWLEHHPHVRNQALASALARFTATLQD